MLKIVSIIILCSTVFIACHNSPCGRAKVLLGLVNFSDSELDTLVIRTYTKGANFSTSIDSIVLAREGSHFSRRGDTVLVLESKAEIIGDHDYSITLPIAGRLYRLNEIYELITEGRHNKVHCINPIKSYRINNQLVIGKDRYDIIYLTR